MRVSKVSLRTGPRLLANGSLAKKSLVRKGDAVEVSIALCMASPTRTAQHRKEYLESCTRVNVMLDRTNMRLFSGDGEPILAQRPNPTNDARFLMFCYFEKHARDEHVRAAFSQKAFEELTALVKHVG